MAESDHPLRNQDDGTLTSEKGSQVPVLESLDWQSNDFDHGIRAWGTGVYCPYETSSPIHVVTVVGSWLVQFCIIGLPLSFGVTESFYAREYLAHYTPSQINWIGPHSFRCIYLSL